MQSIATFTNMKSLKWKTVRFNVEANRNTRFHFQMESWLTSSHFLHSRRKTLTHDVVVLQFIWSNFQLLKNQALMLTLMNLVLLIMKKKAVQSILVCLSFFFLFVFFFLFNLQRHSLILGNDSYADCHILGKGKGINSEILLLILNLHVFKINQFWNMKWWFFKIYMTWGLKTFIQWLRPY